MVKFIVHITHQCMLTNIVPNLSMIFSTRQFIILIDIKRRIFKRLYLSYI